MTPEELIAEFESAGVVLSLEGERVVCELPPEMSTFFFIRANATTNFAQLLAAPTIGMRPMKPKRLGG